MSYVYHVAKLLLIVVLYAASGKENQAPATVATPGDAQTEPPLGRVVRWLTTLERNIYSIKDESIYFRDDFANFAQRHGRTVPTPSDPESEIRCYGVYGCFSIGRPWTSSIRPINAFPEPPEVVNPRFCLLTRRNPDTCQMLKIGDAESVSRSNLQPNRPVFFITHGYLENGNKKWIQRMVDEALIYDDLNAIIIDWVGGSGPPYTQAVANIRLIGVMVAHFIVYLKDSMGIRPEQCHIAGHSLGSHLAGYAGHRLRELGYRLGRISGLDPAEPYFENAEHIIRLDPSDALFVDVIHTDAGPIISGGLGLMQPSGHVDFYPNGGIRQPGCGESVLDSIEKEHGSLLYGLRRFIGCNHIRAYEFYTESFNSPCPFLSVQCPSWEDFRSGRCNCGTDGSHCFLMGYKANLMVNGATLRAAQTQAYLTTNSIKPFCQYHHRITLVISDTEESLRHGGDRGTLYIILHGDLGRSEPIQLTEEQQIFKPGSVHTYVVGTRWLGNIRTAELEWHYSRSVFNPLTWRILSSPALYVNALHIHTMETGVNVELCGGDLAMYSTERRLLSVEANCRRQSLSASRQLNNDISRSTRKSSRRNGARRFFFFG